MASCNIVEGDRQEYGPVSAEAVRLESVKRPGGRNGQGHGGGSGRSCVPPAPAEGGRQPDHRKPPVLFELPSGHEPQTAQVAPPHPVLRTTLSLREREGVRVTVPGEQRMDPCRITIQGQDRQIRPSFGDNVPPLA